MVAHSEGKALYSGHPSLTTEGYLYTMKLFLDFNYVTKDQMDWVLLAASLCRNTLMRLSFAGTTGYGIFEWKGDHCTVKYPRDKADHSGERTIPRSLYSNPNNPL